MNINSPIQELILDDYTENVSQVYENPNLLSKYLLELSIFRTFAIKQNLLEDFKEFEHTFVIENNIFKENNI